MKRDENTLREAFPAMPETVRQALMNAARSVREEKTMKRTTLRTIALAALIIIAATALAYAAFPSQVAEFFGRRFGQETREWLEQGEAATPRESITLGGLTFTMEEVIYRNKGLYGLVTITGEGAENASVYIDKIAAGSGEPMAVKSAGYDDEKQPDGSVKYSFEASDGVVIGKSAEYTLYLTAMAGSDRQDWVVTIQPEPMATNEVETTVPAGTSGQQTGEIRVIVPDEYTKTGTLPVYKAGARDFGQGLRPELFNRSGIAQRKEYSILFEDEAQLSWAPEALFYNEYKGTYNGNYKQPELPEMTLAMPTLSNAAGMLANDVHFGWHDEERMYADLKLEKTSLSGITFDEAKAKVETLLAELDVEGYACDYALDMDVGRIRTLGESRNRWLQSGGNPSNAPIVDYSPADESDEGYYLRYGNGMGKSSDGMFQVTAYVTGKGIVSLNVTDAYQRGEVSQTPGELIKPESILKRLPEEIANSRFSGRKALKIVSLELTYAPARASDGEDGMVLTPAWLVRYFDTENESYDAWAVFNAVDGAIINAIFL